tara:strand:- start:4151 stop:7354 length:3204 start_codon:yes stop_codon:yes gene_type:complete
LSFKKLNDIFKESDKFNQLGVIEPTDVKESVPTQLDTVTPSQMAEKFANKRVEQIEAGFGAGVDFLPNDKASGFNKPQVGQTEIQNISITPISQQGIDGELGPALAENNLLTDKTIFRPKLKTLADTLFEQKIIDKSQGSIIGTSLKNEEIAFNENLREGGIDGTTSIYEAALGSLAGPYQGGGVLSGKGIGSGFQPGYVGGILSIPENIQKAQNHQGFIPNQKSLQPRVSEQQMSENANKKGSKAGDQFGKLGIGGGGTVSTLVTMKSSWDQKKANAALPPNSPSGFIDINPMRKLIGKSASDTMQGWPSPLYSGESYGGNDVHTGVYANVHTAHYMGGGEGGTPIKNLHYSSPTSHWGIPRPVSFDFSIKSIPGFNHLKTQIPEHGKEVDSVTYVSPRHELTQVHPYLMKTGNQKAIMANAVWVNSTIGGDSKVKYQKYAGAQDSDDALNADNIFTKRGFVQSAMPPLNAYISAGPSATGGMRIGTTINSDVPGMSGEGSSSNTGIGSRREGVSGISIFSGLSMDMKRSKDTSDSKDKSHFADSSLRNNAWDKFYNEDHTNKAGYWYGPNVSLDNRNIHYQGKDDVFQSSVISRTSDITGGKLNDLLGGKFLTKEPYIVGRMPKQSGEQKSGVEKIKDELIRMADAYSPLKNAVGDVERIGKYLSSANGVAFIAKQELLGAMSKTVHVVTDDKGNRQLVRGRQRHGAFYDPIRGTLASVGSRLFQGGDNVLYTRTPPAGADEETYYAGGNPTTMAHSKGGRGKGVATITADKTIEDTFTGAKPLSVLTNTRALEIAAEHIVAKEIGYGEGGVLKTKSQGGDRMTLAPLVQGSNLEEAFANIQQFTDADSFEQEQNGLPFYFKDLRDNSYLLFRAYITGFTEEISPTWNNTNYVGRSEPVYNYDSTERSLSFTLKLFAHTEDELTAIYVKMNRLTSMCYPEYVNDDQIVASNFIKIKPKPPLLKLRVGELIGKRDNEVIGFIKSLSYSYPDETPWETKPGKRVPKSVEVTIGYQVIHATTPSLSFAKSDSLENESFYGITTPNVIEEVQEGSGTTPSGVYPAQPLT